MNLGERATAVTRILTRIYPDRRPLLNYSSPFELVISVILSAQTTDAQVNRVTPKLFSRFPSPASLAAADVREVEAIVHSTGFYRNKAKNIVSAARVIHELHGDTVPATMEALVSIPGVGRKSANVILGVVYGEPSIVVDTHLARVTKRLGLVSAGDPARIERELRLIVPTGSQTDFSMAVNLHGRRRCYARKPDCGVCELFDICEWPDRFDRATPEGQGSADSGEAGAEVGD